MRYFIIFMLILISGLSIQYFFEKKELKEQEELFAKFINMEFQGIIYDFERIPRGMKIKVGNNHMVFGMRGVPLNEYISINDSIVKKRGDGNFYLFKRDTNNYIYDSIIISGY